MALTGFDIKFMSLRAMLCKYIKINGACARDKQKPKSLVDVGFK